MLNSFKCAITGILDAIRIERNLKIMFCFLIAVIIAGILFGISLVEWSLVILCCGIVISFELINTAIEKAVDLITSQPKQLARQAKDMAAGAVLIAALISVVIGCIVFIPHILSLLGE